jgi:hypothetical protein
VTGPSDDHRRAHDFARCWRNLLTKETPFGSTIELA